MKFEYGFVNLGLFTPSSEGRFDSNPLIFDPEMSEISETDSDRESFQLRDFDDSTVIVQSRNSLDVRADLPRLESAAGAQPWIVPATPSSAVDHVESHGLIDASVREFVFLLASLFGFLWFMFFGFWWFPISGFCLFVFCAIASDIRGRKNSLRAERGSAGRGVKGVFDPPEHLLTSFHTFLVVEFGGHLPSLPSF